MRIVIDLQGAQTASRFRGIGRYTSALARGMLRHAGSHEIWLLLNAALDESIEPVRAAFAGLVPPERICVFDVPSPVAEMDARHEGRTRAAELLREYCLARLQPDMVLVTSLFEGYIDDAVASVGLFGDASRSAVILYDLIPFLNPDAYLGLRQQRLAYERKIASLRRAGLLLSISDYARSEAIEALQLHPDQVVPISTAVDDSFQPGTLDPAALGAVRARFGVTRAMLMYAPGGVDPRKNIPGLITAFSLLPAPLRAAHQLVLASRMRDSDSAELRAHAARCGLADDEVVITGYVADADLIALYQAATLFIFPSLHEGFGLPALEAMACGAAVIGSDSTSIPEVIGLAEAMFDARSPQAMASRIGEVLGDPALLARLRARGRSQAARFSWDTTAQRALRAMENHVAALPARPAPDPEAELARLLAALAALPELAGDEATLVALAQCLATMPDPLAAPQLLVDVSDGVPPGLQAGATEVVLSDQGGVWHYRYPHGAVADLRPGDRLLCARRAPGAEADGLYAHLLRLGVEIAA